MASPDIRETGRINVRANNADSTLVVAILVSTTEPAKAIFARNLIRVMRREGTYELGVDRRKNGSARQRHVFKRLWISFRSPKERCR